jgi:hypothetical protein
LLPGELAQLRPLALVSASLGRVAVLSLVTLMVPLQARRERTQLHRDPGALDASRSLPMNTVLSVVAVAVKVVIPMAVHAVGIDLFHEDENGAIVTFVTGSVSGCPSGRPRFPTIRSPWSTVMMSAARAGDQQQTRCEGRSNLAP